MEVVTLWLAVDDSDAENGCMRVLPATHTMQLHDMVQAEGESVLGSQIPPGGHPPARTHAQGAYLLSSS